MAEIATLVSLAGYASGTLGAMLLFVEFFQLPNYVTYDQEWDNWQLEVSPAEVKQHTIIGPLGALLVALAFALQFVATLL